MNLNDKAIVFDTNSYRKLVLNKSSDDIIDFISNLKNAEYHKNIQVFGVLIVGLEMLANLVEDTDGPNYLNCLNGVIAMSNHCFDNKLVNPKYVTFPQMQVLKSFFNDVPEQLTKMFKNFGGVIDDFRVDYRSAVNYHYSNKSFINIRDFINKEENLFAINTIDLIEYLKNEVLKVYPKISPKHLIKKTIYDIENGPFQIYLAATIIDSLINSLNIKISIEERKNLIESLINEFPLSIGFFKWICTKLIRDDINMLSKKSQNKNWNWIWDYQLTFLINNHKLDNRNLVLVTSDKDITRMIIDYGYNDRVITIDDYLQIIDFK